MADEKVNFFPTKKLFIDVLTRDISVYDCIFELIDNSVDAYTRNEIKDKRKIKLKISKNEFEIYDNCGGIPKKFLIDNVFRLGITTFDSKHMTIGTYGIGLKRSLFKLANVIEFETNDGITNCKLVIDKNWLQNEKDWDLPVKIFKTSSKEEKFTKIKITDLRYEAREMFTEGFFNDLGEKIGIFYTKFIQEKKIDFYLNEKKLEPHKFEVITPDGISPVEFNEKYKDVKIRILCWIQKGGEKRDYKKPKGKTGWTIFINKRLILLDDITKETGWDGGPLAEEIDPEENITFLPKFHPIYNQFRGIVELESIHPSSLPLNTYKNGLNKENNIYIHLIVKMCEIARPIIDFLNEKYKNRKEEMELKEDEFYDEITAINSKDEKGENAFNSKKYPESFKPPVIIQTESPKYTSIHYKRPKRIVDKLKEILGSSKNSEVGEKTFDYYIECEGIEEDE
jgi:hypothetical protein